MSQSLSKVALHLIFSTKDRVRSLCYPELRIKLEGYIVGILNNIQCPSIATKSQADHIHILFLLSRTRSIAEVVQLIKQESSAWIKEQLPERKDPYLMKFHWQKGYAILSVSESQICVVKKYVEGQDEHHKHTTFQDEYRAFLKRHNVEYDERYVWD